MLRRLAPITRLSARSLQEYDLSEECQIALIKNGIPTNRMLRNEYCQVTIKMLEKLLKESELNFEQIVKIFCLAINKC